MCLLASSRASYQAADEPIDVAPAVDVVPDTEVDAGPSVVTTWDGEGDRKSPPPPPPPPRLNRYGDAGTHHTGLSLGFGSAGGDFVFAAGLEYGYFVAHGVAPVAEVGHTRGSDILTVTRAGLALRLLPLRTSAFGLLLVPRMVRLFITDHENSWGAGGTVAVILWTGPRAGIQLGFDYLRLFPSEGCADLAGGCGQQRFGAGFVLAF